MRKMCSYKMKRNRLFAIVVLFVVVGIFNNCASIAPVNQWLKLRGETMGTYYAITYQHPTATNYQTQIDSILKAFNQSLSIYIADATISEFNTTAPNTPIVIDEHFAHIFAVAKQVYKLSDGAFNPTVMPLVNAYGFGSNKKTAINSTLLDSLVQLVNFDAIQLNTTTQKPQISKTVPNVQLDFGAIAKGYAVDLLLQFLQQQGVKNALVDIGGELRAMGVNDTQQLWQVGIDKPLEQARVRQLQEIVALDNKAIATSGNYRNFYTENGVKYAHTINPKTGRPALSRLLSVSVFAPTCVTADAYATAFMVMGYPKAKQFVENHKSLQLSAYFIYADETGALQTDKTAGVLLAE